MVGNIFTDGKHCDNDVALYLHTHSIGIKNPALTHIYQKKLIGVRVACNKRARRGGIHATLTPDIKGNYAGNTNSSSKNVTLHFLGLCLNPRDLGLDLSHVNFSI